MLRKKCELNVKSDATACARPKARRGGVREGEERGKEKTMGQTRLPEHNLYA